MVDVVDYELFWGVHYETVHSQGFSGGGVYRVVCCVAFYGVPFVFGELFEIGGVYEGEFSLCQRY